MNADVRQMLPRAGSGLSVLLTVVLAVLFFVPWVKVKCSGPMGKRTVAKATGWQLATGDVTRIERAPMGLGGQTQPPTPSQDPAAADINARPWFYLGLLIPLAGAILSLLSVGGRLALASAGKALIVVGILGVVIAILAANVDYSDEIKMPPPQATPQARGGPPGQALGNAMGEAMMQGLTRPAAQTLVTEPTGAVWWSLVLYAIVAACGVANLVLPSMLRRSPSPEPPQPAPSPPTPDATDEV